MFKEIVSFAEVVVGWCLPCLYVLLYSPSCISPKILVFRGKLGQELLVCLSVTCQDCFPVGSPIRHSKQYCCV